MDLKQLRKEKALDKEMKVVQKQEQKLLSAAKEKKPAQWKTELESRIPQKVYAGLESAFCKGFSVVFEKGRSLIEKTYPKQTLQDDYTVRDFAVKVKGGKKELRQMHKSATKSDFLNLAVTTVEGVGLGALGIGLPDIVLFLSTLLKGIYETALNYGIDYCLPEERMLILKMMYASLQTGEAALEADKQVEEALTGSEMITGEMLQNQIKLTASGFAMDMLLLKFVQGIPVVGILGGAANPVYYRKILRYVQLKYRKRYLNGIAGQK